MGIFLLSLNNTIVFCIVFFVDIVTLRLHIKSALKAYDSHMTATCGNYKMVMHPG